MIGECSPVCVKGVQTSSLGWMSTSTDGFGPSSDFPRHQVVHEIRRRPREIRLFGSKGGHPLRERLTLPALRRSAGNDAIEQRPVDTARVEE